MPAVTEECDAVTEECDAVTHRTCLENAAGSGQVPVDIVMSG